MQRSNTPETERNREKHRKTGRNMEKQREKQKVMADALALGCQE